MPNAIPPMSESLRKRITIPAKPTDPDAWVHQPPPAPVADLVRLSVDIPKAVRKALKQYAAAEDASIRDVVLGLIEDRLRAKGYLK